MPMTHLAMLLMCMMAMNWLQTDAVAHAAPGMPSSHTSCTALNQRLVVYQNGGQLFFSWTVELPFGSCLCKPPVRSPPRYG